ncbi:LamG-like jellyroll fold domain-containing protein [Micromonospora sp. NPDC047730]|uniref:LamG-like jellyroll fold domain-containing protein n=1 Tax=Micromonospora sp. NPDC047730 TaxID=3364253 RepID=UPI00371B0824
MAALLVACLAAGGVVLAPVTAAAPASPRAASGPSAGDAMPDGPIGRPEQPAFPDGYVQRVQAALRQGTDTWGEQLMALPDGPTMANMRDLLVPANHGDDFWHDTRWNNLPLTYPMPDLKNFSAQRDFSFHFTDGSQINSDFADGRTRQWVKFYVGDGTELYGSAETRLDEPTLADGYQPVLQNRYTDRQGRTYERESYVTRFSGSARLMSMIRFIVRPGNSGQTSATLRVNLNGMYVAGAVAAENNLKVGDKLALAYSGQAAWSAPDLTYTLDLSKGPAEVHLLMMNQPQALGTVVMDSSGYDARRAQMIAYWKGQLDAGSGVQIPEKYAADAMRSMLLTNLVMGYNLTIGNGYELPDDPKFAWIPEVVATVGSLGDFGYAPRTRQTMDEFLVRGQYLDGFTTWERGIKLQAAARYHLQTGDSGLITAHLATFKAWLNDIAAQRSNDPNGLLAKTSLYSDNSARAHGIHHQADVWRGLRDMGVVLRLIGRPDDAAAFTAQADGLRAATLAAIDRSKTQLPDGSVFVPVALLEPNDFDPAGMITNSPQGSYWNLIMPYALGSGLIDLNSPVGQGLTTFLNKHGATFLGLTRFNLSGEPVEACQTRPAGPWPAADGYRSSGVDQQYGWSYLKYLDQIGDADRIGLTFYGMLAQGFTRNTFIGGEGETVAPCPMEYYRSQFRAPLSPNNATYLKALRGMLVNETLDAAGVPTELDLAPATPKPWLSDGQTVGVTKLPTLFGPVTYSITSAVARGTIEATVTPPPAAAGRPGLQQVKLHLRLPAGYRLEAATANGAAVAIEGDAVTVPGTGTTTVRATVSRVKVGQLSRAQVVATELATMVAPGATTDLGMLVEMSGTAVVQGRISVDLPNGWTPSSEQILFARNARNGLAWQQVRTRVSVPENAAPGDYRIVMTARPDGGEPRAFTTTVTVARPAPGTYADLVRADGAVGYWRLDDSGATVLDRSGHGNNGVVRGSVVQGQPGPLAAGNSRSMSLEGGYIEVPDSASLSLTGPYALEAWVYVREGGDQGVLEKYDSPARNGYLLRLGAKNRPAAMNLSDSLSTTGPVGAPVLQWGWHHLVSVFDGSTLKVYLDGTERASVPISRVPTDGAASLKIGARGDDAANRFGGWMSEVAVYDRALTPDMVKAHYVKGVTVVGR